MSVWASAGKADRKRIRKEMLIHVSAALIGQYPVAAKRRAMAREIVDRALAKESSSNEQADSLHAQ